MHWHEVKRSTVKVKWLSNALPAWVCRSIRLLRFLVLCGLGPIYADSLKIMLNIKPYIGVMLKAEGVRRTAMCIDEWAASASAAAPATDLVTACRLTLSKCTATAARDRWSAGATDVRCCQRLVLVVDSQQYVACVCVCVCVCISALAAAAAAAVHHASAVMCAARQLRHHSSSLSSSSYVISRARCSHWITADTLSYHTSNSISDMSPQRTRHSFTTPRHIVTGTVSLPGSTTLAYVVRRSVRDKYGRNSHC